MKFQNFFAAKLYTDIGASDTAITLDTAPVATSGRMVLEARNPTQREIISFTGVSGNQLTGVVRGVGGTTAKSHLKNALIEMNITADDIQDLYDAFNSFSANNNDWRSLATTPTSVVYNGQRGYTLTFNGVDYTNILNPGTRLRTTRTVAAPTQCASLNGTNQYFNNTTPNKMSFTNNFVLDVDFKTSTISQYQTIVSRWNGTSGWELTILTDGRLIATGFNNGGSNTFAVSTEQSVIINEKTRVTVQMDMSTTATGGTYNYIMVNGVEVPIIVTRGGTSPTSLVQAGNFDIGCRLSSSAAQQFFKGNIYQVAVFNAKVTPAQIRAYHSQSYTGSEANLISAYSFNGVSTDLMVTTPNNLTAVNAAGYTADSTFGTQNNNTINPNLDYMIISTAVFTGGNTVVTGQTPIGCAVPTAGGVSAVSYSQTEGFGFPKDPNRWCLTVHQRTNKNIAIGALNVDTPSPWVITAPIGSWLLSMSIALVTGQGSTTGAGYNDLAMLVKGAVQGQVPGLYMRTTYNSAPNPNGIFLAGKLDAVISQSAVEAFTVYGNMANFSGGSASYSLRGDLSSPNVLMLKNSYL